MLKKSGKRYANMTDEEKRKETCKGTRVLPPKEINGYSSDDPCFNPRYDIQFCLFMLFDNSNFWSM